MKEQEMKMPRSITREKKYKTKIAELSDMLDHDKTMLRLRTSLRLICRILQLGRKQQLVPITRLGGPSAAMPA